MVDVADLGGHIGMGPPIGGVTELLGVELLNMDPCSLSDMS